MEILTFLEVIYQVALIFQNTVKPEKNTLMILSIDWTTQQKFEYLSYIA